MDSTVKVLDHPLHPILVHFPIALLATSVIFDTIGLMSPRGIWEDVALWDIVAGLTAAFVAAIPGLLDYRRLKLDPDASRIATFHFVFNLIVVLLFGLSLAWRIELNYGADADLVTFPSGPFFLSLIGVICLAVSGALGSQLVFKHQAGVVVMESDLPAETFAKSGRM